MSRLSNLLFPQSSLAILIADSASLKISEVNSAAGRLFHQDPHDLQNIPLEKICACGEFSRLENLLEPGARPQTVSLNLLRKNNESFHAELRTSLLESGTSREWALFARDISSEFETREALRRSEIEYRRMVENSPDGIVLIRGGVVVFANAPCHHMLGLGNPQELWATEFENYVHPDDIKIWRSGEEKVMAGLELNRCELRLLKPGGKATYVELAQSLIERPDGRAMQATLREIGARKKMEALILESEERYKGLASVAFDGVAIHFYGILVDATRSFEALFGYEAGEIKGSSIYELVVENQRELFKREIHNSNVLELEGLRKDGRHFYFEACTRPCTFSGEPAFVMAIRDISKRKNDELDIRHQAYFDGLTGLPNRLLFFDRLCVAIEQAARDQRLLAVMFLDLDRFKNVNDALGHNVGDLLLFEVGERISGCLRKGDTVGRLGGDEFTILLNEIKSPEEALQVAEKIVAAINLPYMIQEQSITIGISIGIALYPEHAVHADGLIKAADAAMYHAKDDGRNRCQLFSADKAVKSDKLGLESRLRRGIEDREFTLYYQPKIDLASGRLDGVEALVRWKHPERGLVMPDNFIPLAEETRLILPLGAWILNEACRQARAWEGAGIKISVNLSPWQLQDPSLIATIDAALKKSDARPGMIDLEITETAAMKNLSRTLSLLRDLTSRGFSVSLDDFGKGYSSLNYLKQFPVSTIKIDMSFIRELLREPKDVAIVRAIILMGHNLDMKVLAEGVEDAEHEEFLRREGCDLAQGYFYSKPVPVDEFERLYPFRPFGIPKPAGYSRVNI